MVSIGSPWRTNCHDMEHIENLYIERLWEQDNKCSCSFYYFCSNLCYITLRLCNFYTSIYSNNSLLNVKIGQYLIISAIWYRQFYVVEFLTAVMWYRTKYRSLTFWFISVCSGVVVPLKAGN